MNPIRKPINWRPAFGIGGARLNQLKLLGVKLGDRVLEESCLMGFVIGNINSKERYGIDINPYFLVHAHRDFHDVKFSPHPPGATGFKDSFFDTVICFDVMERTTGDIKMLEEAWRILKPSGNLIVSASIKGAKLLPLSGDLTELVQKKWGQVREYDVKELKKILEANGFKVVKKRTHLRLLSRLLYYAYMRHSAYMLYKNQQMWAWDKWLKRLERLIKTADSIERFLRIGRPFQVVMLAVKEPR